MRKSIFIFVLYFTAAFGGVFCAHAASTWYVATNGDDVNNDGKSASAPFKTIQKGIDSAANNDTVEIADGTYYISAPLSLDLKNIEVRSASLDPAKVIVDAERRCVCISNGTTAYHNIINSITFQNGYSSAGEKVAGGIFSLSKTLVTNCVVRRCYHETSSGNAYGGGVCIESPAEATAPAWNWPVGRQFLTALVDTLVEDCAVCSKDTTKRNIRGGGLSLRNVNATRLTVRHCAATNFSPTATSVQQTCGGGGFFTFGTFTNCVVDGCVAMDTNAEGTWRGSGGGLYLEGNASNPCTVQDSLFINNWAMSFGGAIANSYSKNINIIGCTITNNLVGNPKPSGLYQPGGGGLAFTGTEDVSIADCLIANNDTTADPGAIFCGGGIVVSEARVTVAGCVIRDNVSGYAGAFSFVSPKDVAVTNCVIEGNVCTQQHSVVRFFSTSTSADNGASFVDCLVLSNENRRIGAAGQRAMFYYSTPADKAERYVVPFVLRNCFFAGNSENNNSSSDGWGVRVDVSALPQNRPGDTRPVVIDHCTFATNFNKSGGANFIGLNTARACTNTLVKGCVLYGNRYGNSRKLAGCYSKDPAAVAISNTFCEVESDTFTVTAENGNLSTGALRFRDEAAGDFRPDAGSCLYDKGGAFEDWMGDGKANSLSRDMGDGRYTLETVGTYGVKVVRANRNPRRYGTASDMGCFEYWAPPGLHFILR